MAISQTYNRPEGEGGNTEGLYTAFGWIDWEWIFRFFPQAVFIFVYGPRGVGKTYGLLKWIYEHRERFVFMRRTQNELDVVSRPEMQPFGKLNADLGIDMQTKSISKYNTGFYEADDLRGVGVALSTIAHIRGFDASPYNIMAYDEFIPEKHITKIRGEYEAFLNAYETVNRNRELEGKPPVKCVCCANTNRLDSPIFEGAGLIQYVERMRKEHRNVSYLPDRGVLLVDTFDSPISEKKATTAVYRLAGKESEFYKMAIQNSFADLDNANISKENLKNYDPVFVLGDVCIYRNKTLDCVYYASRHIKGSPPVYKGNKEGVDKLKLQRSGTLLMMKLGEVRFEDFNTKTRYENILNGI